jgi:hypothetical protein
MTVVISGTTGVTTPGVTDTGALSVTGITTLGALGSSVITSGTSQASTSGTSIDFTSIPSWVKRITVMFNGVSTGGTSNLLIQIGSGTIQTTGYVASGSALAPSVTTPNGTTSTAGFPVFNSNVSSTWYGSAILTLHSSNIWTDIHSFTTTAGNNIQSVGSGGVTLSGTLDRVRITSITPDTFDAGSINILYE